MSDPQNDCARCGQPVPYHDCEVTKDGDRICSDCWVEENHETCDGCGQLREAVELDAKPGALIGVWDADSGLEPGYYQVLSWPFYADGMIEGSFFRHALQYAGPLTATHREAAHGAMSGALCATCTQQAVRTQTGDADE